MQRVERKPKDSIIEGNRLDKIVNYLSPVRGAKRMKARMFQAVAGSYYGGSKSRRQTKQWTPLAGSADDDTLFDLPTMRERSRDMLRNEPLALGAINTVCTNVIGTGLRLKPAIDAEALGMSRDDATLWESNTKREFNLWAESQNADVSRTLNFYAIQEQAFRVVLESGDVIATMPFVEREMSPYKLAIQLIEGDRLSNKDGIQDTPTLTAGVQKDALGAPISYWIANKYPGAGDVRFADQISLAWKNIPAFGAASGRRNVIHLFTQLRPGQTRGIPYLAPVIEILKVLSSYTEAELMAATISGMFSVFIKTEGAEGIDLATDMGGETGASSGDTDLKMGVGTIVDLEPNESIESVSPGRPNQAFDPFVQAIIRQVGVALEIPFEILIKHFTASYSAARASLLEAWKFFKKRRQWMAENFCQPVYENWMDEAVILGRIEAPGYFTDPMMRKAYLGAQWEGPGRGMIKEKEEAEASLLKVAGGLSTLDNEIAKIEGYGDFETVNRQLIVENNKRIAGGLKEPVGVAAGTATSAAPPEEDEEETREELNNETE